MNAPLKPESRPRRTEDHPAARRADPRRSHLRAGDALLPDLLAIPDPDGLGGDPRRHDVPAPPAARVPDGREAGMGVHADRSDWCGDHRGADGSAGGFAGRRGAGIRAGVQANTLQIPAPRPGVERWPIVGADIHAFWSRAHSDLPALVQSMQPKVGELALWMLGAVAGIGGGMLQFLAAFVIAGVIMAFGEAGARSSEAIFARIISPERAPGFVALCSATIRAVAQGVIGVALIQALVVGVILLVAGIPLAGLLAIIVLVLGIAQLPAVVVLLPVILYIWTSGDYGTGSAIVYSAIAARRRPVGQRPEAADDGPWRRCADAGHPARRLGRHGGQGHGRTVPGRRPAGAGLPDLHGLGKRGRAESDSQSAG